MVQFGASGPSTDFGQFGSKAAFAPQTSQNPSVIQQLAAWATGWTLASVGAAFNPYLEDTNGAFFVFGYFLANIFERGIPDWDAGTTYYKGAAVQDPGGSGQQWYSLTDNNLGNTPPASASNAQWQWNNPPIDVVGAAATTNVIPKVSATAPSGGSPGSVALTDSALTDDGITVKTTLPIKFPDNTIQSTAATNPNAVTVQSPPAAYADTPSRTLGSVYQNTGTKPRFVSVTVAVQGHIAQAFSDSNPSPTQVIAQVEEQAGVTGVWAPMFFIVLPGNYYKVAGTGVTIAYWTEWT